MDTESRGRNSNREAVGTQNGIVIRGEVDGYAASLGSGGTTGS